LLIVPSSILYALSVEYCLADFASVESPEYGYTYRTPDVGDYLLLFAALAILAVVIPRRIDRPSALFLVITYLFVIVPALVAMVALEKAAGGHFYPMLTVLTGSFAAAWLLRGPRGWSSEPRSPAPSILPSVLVLWLACLAVLIFTFGSIMNFASLETLYIQREAGKARDLFDGYAQTYFGYVLSPILLTFGLVQRRIMLIAGGLLGSIVLFMITAEKAVFMFPYFMIAAHFAMQFSRKFWLSTGVVTLGLASVLTVAVALYSSSHVAEMVAWNLGARSLLTPGVYTLHYADFFGDVGTTNLAHVSGFNLIMSAPLHLASDSRWPSIGHIVGEDYIGIPKLNANANFIASDGVAAFGTVGITISLAFFAIFLRVIDRVTQGVPLEYALLMLIPLALVLTNGSLFTAMTSFGGLLMIVLFAYAFKEGAGNGAEGSEAHGVGRMLPRSDADSARYVAAFTDPTSSGC